MEKKKKKSKKRNREETTSNNETDKQDAADHGKYHNILNITALKKLQT